MPLFKLIKGHAFTCPYILMWKKVHNNQNNLTVLDHNILATKYSFKNIEKVKIIKVLVGFELMTYDKAPTYPLLYAKGGKGG